ncbi:hypothetical protein [Granulicella sp. S156]|uniref:hypothetical protein n=1 Tax=Granulicella sp. S156 TaxID=1747224 RepID=UPI0020B10756|nr:hypothetical protein [Granulicella sp. S156]
MPYRATADDVGRGSGWKLHLGIALSVLTSSTSTRSSNAHSWLWIALGSDFCSHQGWNGNPIPSLMRT